jgi:hypothetical protein
MAFPDSKPFDSKGKYIDAQNSGIRVFSTVFAPR